MLLSPKHSTLTVLQHFIPGWHPLQLGGALSASLTTQQDCTKSILVSFDLSWDLDKTAAGVVKVTYPIALRSGAWRSELALLKGFARLHLWYRNGGSGKGSQRKNSRHLHDCEVRCVGGIKSLEFCCGYGFLVFD